MTSVFSGISCSISGFRISKVLNLESLGAMESTPVRLNFFESQSATTSLPTPVSPKIKMGRCILAKLLIFFLISRMTLEFPTILLMPSDTKLVVISSVAKDLLFSPEMANCKGCVSSKKEDAENSKAN